eukprot:CAMPEP_0202827134 /NCGR_PEP_ID=MMETSP1389-20130828/14071_1 /ASSEMBLY_ACC=CAM_ASM_000865 /TAXON_ID=302021 /ORGANISM="Rhodomonas sp., Strain CCMP768" /LENGTH=99 /DNA_ID=CAMNT_0049500505 /DNA_START=24 /DNA_END=323 /DNA_ORIENTATION=+
MLINIAPFLGLASTYTRQDGWEMTGDTGTGHALGFDIVDNYWYPMWTGAADPDVGKTNLSMPINVDTRYGGGPGLGVTSELGPFKGSEEVFPHAPGVVN